MLKQPIYLPVDVENLWSWIDAAKDALEGLEEQLKSSLVDEVRGNLRKPTQPARKGPKEKLHPWLAEEAAEDLKKKPKKRKKPMSQAARDNIGRAMRAHHKRVKAQIKKKLENRP